MPKPHHHLLLAAALALAGCAGQDEVVGVPDPAYEPVSTTPLVTVVFGQNGLGDRSYNDLINQGVERTALELGLRTMQVSPPTTAQGLASLEQLFAQIETVPDTVRRLIIVTSPIYDAYLRANSHRLESNPYAQLLYLETDRPLPHKGATLYMPYYGAMFEAGTLYRTLPGNSLMVVGANRHTPSVTDAIRGFADGFESQLLRPSASTYSVCYLDSVGQGGFSLPDTTALRLMSQWDAQGYNMLLPICGSGFNTFERLNAIQFWYWMLIGIDIPYQMQFSIFSVFKHTDRAVQHCIRQWLSAQGLPKHQVLGLAEGYTGVYHNYRNYDYGSEEPFASFTADTIARLHAEAIRKETEYEGRKQP